MAAVRLAAVVVVALSCFVAALAIRVENAKHHEPSMAQMKKDHALTSELLEIIPQEAAELRKSHEKVMGSLIQAHERLKQLEKASTGEDPGLAAQEAHLQAMRARILAEISESARGLSRLGAKLSPAQLAAMANPEPDHHAAKRVLRQVSPSLLSFYEKLHNESQAEARSSGIARDPAGATRQVLQLIHGLEHHAPAQNAEDEPVDHSRVIELVKQLRDALVRQLPENRAASNSDVAPSMPAEITQPASNSSDAQPVHEFQGVPERVRFLLGSQGALECSCLYKDNRQQAAAGEEPILGAADTTRPWIPAPGAGDAVSPAHCYDSCQEFKCTPVFRASGWDQWHDCVQGCVSKCYGKDAKAKL